MRDGAHAKRWSNARDRVRKGQGQAPKTRKIMEGLDANPYTTKSDAYRDTTHDFAGIRTRDPTSPRRAFSVEEPRCN